MLRVVPVSVAMLCLVMQPARAEIVWHWQDQFSAEEKANLTQWITETVAGVENLVAPYPFDIHISFYRSERDDSPVPWAETVRSRQQGVNFHVNTEYSLAEFFDDWTAPHELSHLLLPYVGRTNAWFAEGFASYMQYQVMYAMRIIDDEQMQARYRTKIDKAERQFDLSDLPFTDAADRLVARREYPTMYWGGAVYFLQVDRLLQPRGNSMLSVLRQFVECCRVDTRSFNALIGELDRLAAEPVFGEQLEIMRGRPGFPDNSGIWPGVAGE